MRDITQPRATRLTRHDADHDRTSNKRRVSSASSSSRAVPSRTSMRDSQEERKGSLVEPESSIRPFEWLTNASSLESTLSSLFDTDSQKNSGLEIEPSLSSRRALHVGCGSSTLGEYLVQKLRCAEVVNVDVDKLTLQQMQKRWEDVSQHSEPDTERLKFCHCDLATGRIPYQSGYFDLVVDKSTLDCTLCSDEASAGLLCEVYRCLNPVDGVYVLVSFHHLDLLVPLLENLPGTEWTVTHKVMFREVEDLRRNDGELASVQNSAQNSVLPVNDGEDRESAWVSGSFSPDEHYRRTVNVLLCRRRRQMPPEARTDVECNIELDRETVRNHIHKTNDDWFQIQNPMLTRTRREDLDRVFESAEFDRIALRKCYEVIFTAAEREHLTYENFLEDWVAFLETHDSLPDDSMTLEVAVAFLHEMQ